MEGLGDGFFLHEKEDEDELLSPFEDLSNVELEDTIIKEILEAPEELQDHFKTRQRYQNVELNNTFISSMFRRGGENGTIDIQKQMSLGNQPPYRQTSQTREFHQYVEPYQSNNPTEEEEFTIPSPPPPVHPPVQTFDDKNAHSFIRRPKSTPPTGHPSSVSQIQPPPRIQPPLTSELPDLPDFHDSRKSSVEKFFTNGDSKKPPRKFRLVYRTDKFEGTNTTVFMKTRRETRSNDIDDRLYSSLKYELQMEVTCDVQAHVFFPVFFLIGKVCIVESLNYSKVVRPGGVLKGVTSSTLSNQGGKGLLTGVFHIQFLGLSYYHEKREFNLQIELFDQNDLMNPVMVLRSPSFRVYSRKPTVKKRKRRYTAQQRSDRGFLVKRRANETSNPFQRFTECLQDMLENLDMIQDQREKENAMTEIRQELMKRDGKRKNDNQSDNPLPPPPNFMDPNDTNFSFI